MTSNTIGKVGGIGKVVSELKKLRGKQVKIVYKEHTNKEPYISEGVVKGCESVFCGGARARRTSALHSDQRDCEDE